ncbi:MAG: hypothetical protein CL725_09195 [Chloroflexi bacterium]|nr:hypothetical protein [Chloroflexota bacterium]
MEWRSFVRTHLGDDTKVSGAGGFVGELSGAGVVIVLDSLVTKGQLNRIRSAFPSTINRITPTNSPMRRVAWVLDVPAQRIWDAAEKDELTKLANDVEQWALDVSSVVDYVAQSSTLAHEHGEWDAALRCIRRALWTEGGKKNGYLYRLATNCSFSLGDRPSALRYAPKGVKISRDELGSGFVRSMCQEADAYLYLGDPVRAWDLYTAAAKASPGHPLPRYYRGQGLLLLTKLLDLYQRDSVEYGKPSNLSKEVLDELVTGAMDDLTVPADLLDHWGLISESYQYRNSYLVPTLMGQGLGYLLNRAPGPTASRLQSARKPFPKDDLFCREYIFAKCWHRGLQRKYGELLTGDAWEPLRVRLRQEFGGR